MHNLCKLQCEKKIGIQRILVCSRQRLRSMSSVLPDAEEDERQAVTTRLEESFTIHLGQSHLGTLRYFLDRKNFFCASRDSHGQKC